MKNVFQSLVLAMALVLSVGCGKEKALSEAPAPAAFNIVGNWENTTLVYQFAADSNYTITSKDGSNVTTGTYTFASAVVTITHPGTGLSDQNFDVLDASEAGMKLKNKKSSNVIELTKVK